MQERLQAVGFVNLSRCLVFWALLNAACDGTSPLQFDPDDLMIADEMQYELIILRAPTCSLP